MNNHISTWIARSAFTALLVAATGASAESLTNGLTFYAPFNGSFGDVAGGLSGAPFNAPALQAAGGAGGGGYLQLQNQSGSPKQAVWYSDPTPATNDFSFQIWVRCADEATAVNGQPNNDVAFAANKDWDSGSNVGWAVAKNSASANPAGLWWNMNTAGGSRRDFRPADPSVVILDGVWHQIVVTYQRAGQATFYRDGVPVGSVNILPNRGQSMRPALGSWVTNNIFALGEDATLRYDHNSGSAFNGDLDEVAMWNRVLSPSEVMSAYVKGTNGVSLMGTKAPVIVQQPQGGTRFASDSFRLECLVAGDPVTCQWYKDGKPVLGATNSLVVLPNLAAADAGDYRLVITGADGGSITSAPAALVVSPVPGITSGLAVYLNLDSNVLAQAGTTVSGVATGADPVEKYTNGIIGAAAVFNNDASSSATPTDWAVSLGDIEWIYARNWTVSLWVKATRNDDGGLMGNKDWTSGANPGWVFAPYNSVELNFNTAVPPFSARYDIGGATILNAQWHHAACVFNRDANRAFVYLDGNLTASAPLGTTGLESLTPTSFSPNITLLGGCGNGPYSGAAVLDDVGVWQRALTLDEILAIYAQGLVGQPLTTAVAGSAIRPVIGAQPQGLQLFEGRKCLLTVAATGTAPLAYQWFKNGSRIADATNSSLAFNPATISDSGSYTVVVTNLLGSVTSAPPALVAVLPITDISTGLAVYLNFDDNLDAQGGTTNYGTAVGSTGVPKYEPGVIGASARFDNDNSDNPVVSDWAVSLGDVEWIYAGSWSFSTWVKSLDTYGGLLGNKDWLHGENVGWVISEYYTDWLNYRASGASRHDIGDFNWADDTWHHVAAVFDRDANTVSTYVDGVATAQASLGTTGLESLTPGEIRATLVGSSGNGTESGYGNVDDLGIWCRPLSATEILSICVQGLKGQPLTSASRNPIAPFITHGPQSQTRISGLRAQFTATAKGSPAMGYQWRKNGLDIPGATGSVLNFPVALSDNGAAYTVVVSNPYGAATSSPPAVLTVLPAKIGANNGLVVYLNFESNILAQAGTSISGTPLGMNGVEKYTAGIVGQAAAQFDNDADDAYRASDWAVSLGDIEWIYTNNWSFSVWVRTTDDYGTLLGNKDWYSGDNIGWCISAYHQDWLNYRAIGGSRYDIGDFAWADDRWHHLAAVFYRDANEVLTYVDGVLTAESSLALTGSESLTPDSPAIGATLVGSSGALSDSGYGAVDDLAMWTRPLSQAELVGIYQAGLAGKGAPQAGLGTVLLSATSAGSSLRLEYPDWARNYTLESASDLAGPWKPVSSTPFVANGKTAALVPIGSGAQFFHLRQ